MQCFAKSDRGAVRKENQDRAAGARIRRKGCVVGVVCDGMGGAAGGKLASELAASTFLAQFRREMMAGSAVESAMRAACDAANQAVYGRACADPELRGMGTTIVAAACGTDGSRCCTSVTAAHIWSACAVCSRSRRITRSCRS